jgi:hypothetical protein
MGPKKRLTVSIKRFDNLLRHFVTTNLMYYYTLLRNKLECLPPAEFVPRACIIKLFTAAINSVGKKASAFAIVCCFLLALTNTLSFYVTELIIPVISFMIQATSLIFERRVRACTS